MKLASFEHNGRPSFGIVHDDGIIDAGTRLKGQPDLVSVLADPGSLHGLQQNRPDYSLQDVRLLPPITQPGKIICVGLNYKTHIAETGYDVPRYPILFPRYPSSLVGAGARLVCPKVSSHFDFEGELAVVIGRAGRHIPLARAQEHVAGYACFNDGSIRDFQRHSSQFLPGKNFDDSGSFGPWLVTPDEAREVGSLQLTTRLNGKIVQQASVGDLLFGVAALIAYISQICTLMPGDVIATGTTGGVGMARTPPLWMKPGDRIEVAIDRLGVLSNEVVAEE